MQKEKVAEALPKKKDLRSFLEEYEEKHPEDFVRVDKEISARYEITAMVHALEKIDRYPVLYFTNVRLPNGQKSKFPVVTNLHGNKRRCAYILNSTYKKASLDYVAQLRNRKKPVVVTRQEAPVKEVVTRRDQVDMSEFPALMQHNMDPAPYVSGGYLVTYDLHTGIDNCALYRGMVATKNELRVWLTPNSHARWMFEKYEEQKKDMRVAYSIGHHPQACLGLGVRTVRFPESHFEAAGAILGQPLRLVPSESLGEDFLVPADCEFVIEGVMRAGKRKPEGPFGEYTKYTGPQHWNPCIDITAITHRKDAIWHDITVGHPDTWHTAGFGQEAGFFHAASQFTNVLGVHLPLSACCRFHAYIKIRKTQEGQGRSVIMACLPLTWQIKHVFVFDEDVDIFDEKEVLWAIATRSQWDKDILVVPRAIRNPYDASAAEVRTQVKAGIDCTKPVPPTPYYPVSKVPDEVTAQFNLEDWIAKEHVEKMPPLR